MNEYGLGHVPGMYYFDDEHLGTPAEVCEACSRPEDGLWVPASFCPEANAIMLERYERQGF